MKKHQAKQTLLFLMIINSVRDSVIAIFTHQAQNCFLKSQLIFNTASKIFTE